MASPAETTPSTKVTSEYATLPSGLTADDAAANAAPASLIACCWSWGRSFNWSGVIPAGGAGQFDPRPPRVGSVTQLTLARSAICCSTGVISLSTSGSTAPPAEADERAVGDQTIRAPAPELAPPSPPLLNSSCAAVDSVAGSEKESFSAPPSWLPSPTIAPSAITQAMSATTGRRIAHLERPGTKKTPQISS
ncbi:unannotated protein [freshwater metagenome]|uniref:Unannotated protein n=1 Tax=freshwater metagenome TaxID=449393 RepID=A0A6J7ARL7_9ZZZZ